MQCHTNTIDLIRSYTKKDTITTATYVFKPPDTPVNLIPWKGMNI